MKRSALRDVDISELPDNFSFLSAMLFEFVRKGFRIGEVPISFKKRVAGKPKYSFKDLLGNVKLLFWLLVRRISGS